MFKLFCKIFISCCFCLCFLLDCGGSLRGEGLHTFYFYQKSSNAKIITLSNQDSTYFLYFKQFLKGESVIFYDNKKAYELIENLSAKKVFNENGNDFDCEYYFSAKLTDYIILNGKKVNLHVCHLNNYLIVGSPINFGSF